MPTREAGFQLFSNFQLASVMREFFYYNSWFTRIDEGDEGVPGSWYDSIQRQQTIDSWRNDQLSYNAANWSSRQRRQQRRRQEDGATQQSTGCGVIVCWPSAQLAAECLWSVRFTNLPRFNYIYALFKQHTVFALNSCCLSFALKSLTVDSIVTLLQMEKTFQM